MHYCQQQLDERRLLILPQAFELFAELGIEAVSVQQIAGTTNYGLVYPADSPLDDERMLQM